MSEVTKEDIRELNSAVGKVHGRIDELINNCITPIKVGIGKIEQKFEDLNIPKQPCTALENHLKDHKEIKSLWQKPLMSNLIDLIRLGIVAVLTWWFVK